jgi:hypothetical protein
MAEEEYNGICPPDENVDGYFKELINENNAANVELFLNNLKKSFLSNYFFNRNSEASLAHACENDKFNVALKLIEIGLRDPQEIDLGQANKDGKTPLIACCSSSDEMAFIVAKELLKGNCRPDARYGEYNKSAIMRACDYKDNSSLLIADALLKYDANLGFQFDNEGKSGLNYLFDYHNDGDKEVFLKNKLYIKFVVNYLKLYYLNKPVDDNFTRVMELICNDPELRKAFSTPLLQVSGVKEGIDLNKYCMSPRDTTGFGFGPLSGTFEAVPNSRLRLRDPEASEVPIVVALPEEGVSPGGRWVSREQARQYIRLYPPGKGPNDGPAGGKKRKTLKKKGLKHNKKSRRRSR